MRGQCPDTQKREVKFVEQKSTLLIVPPPPPPHDTDMAISHIIDSFANQPKEESSTAWRKPAGPGRFSSVLKEVGTGGDGEAGS